MTKSRKRYSDEFKIDAVRLVLDEGLSKAEVSRRLGVGQDSLGKWVRAYKSTNGNAFTGKVELTEEQKELRRLRIENRQLKMEREILKKATAFFAKDVK